VNKQDLAISIAVKFFITQVEAEKIVNFMLEDISKSLSKNKRVYFRGFGSFTRQRRKARRVRNFNTKKMMIIPPHYTVKFTPSVALRKKVEPVHHARAHLQHPKTK